MNRRDFLATATVALPLPSLLRAAPAESRESVALKARPFDLRRIRLRPGPFLDAAEINRRYVTSLDPDRLLHMFRVTAGVPSSAQPFSWTADPRCADYYERAMFNGILGIQHPADGMTLYYVPLASGYWKLFGLPLDAFWCCTGTGVESFGKLGDSIYFHDDAGVYVNLFIASEVEWVAKGVRLVQDTKFPDESTTRLVVRAKAPARMALRVRVPYWATSGGTVKLNGRPLESFATPSSYVVLDRIWRDGDRVEVTFPMSLHVQPMPDEPSLQAILYGPLVLAGRLGTQGLTRELLRAEPTKPRTVPEYKGEPIAAPTFWACSRDPGAWVRPTPGRSLEFQTVGQARNVDLVPLYRILDERYAVYWRVAGPEPARELPR